MVKHILAPLDGSNLAECVLPHVVAMARAFDARVTVLRVLDEVSSEGTVPINPVNWQLMKAQGQRYVDQIAETLEEAGVAVDTALQEGKAADRIISFVDEEDVDLMVLSSHGRSGLYRWNVSSVVQKTIFQANTSVLIVRAYRPAPERLKEHHYEKIFVPIDCSQRAECVFPNVTNLARDGNAEVILAHVVQRPQIPRREPLTEEEQTLVSEITEIYRQEAMEYLQGVQSRMSADVQVRLLENGDIATVLHNTVADEDPDLVVMCAHGQTGATQWPFGSLPLNFIAYGTTPLMVVQDLPSGDVYQSQAQQASREHRGH